MTTVTITASILLAMAAATLTTASLAHTTHHTTQYVTSHGVKAEEPRTPRSLHRGLSLPAPLPNPHLGFKLGLHVQSAVARGADPPGSTCSRRLLSADPITGQAGTCVCPAQGREASRATGCTCRLAGPTNRRPCHPPPPPPPPPPALASRSSPVLHGPREGHPAGSGPLAPPESGRRR